jgi:predicted HicB family RNase H-like nuclease
LPLEQRGREALRLAQEAFTKTGSWVVFYREMLGSDGVVRKLFRESSQMRVFESSNEYAELQEMVAAMRSQDGSKGDATEPERMITIRLPKSLHDALRTEADEMNLSINKLCISKLLQRIESRFIPIQQGRRRGRRPGPQGPRKKATNSGSVEGQMG